MDCRSLLGAATAVVDEKVEAVETDIFTSISCRGGLFERKVWIRVYGSMEETMGRTAIISFATLTVNHRNRHCTAM